MHPGQERMSVLREVSVTAFRRAPVTPPTWGRTILDSQKASEKKAACGDLHIICGCYSASVSNEVFGLSKGCSTLSKTTALMIHTCMEIYNFQSKSGCFIPLDSPNNLEEMGEWHDMTRYDMFMTQHLWKGQGSWTSCSTLSVSPHFMTPFIFIYSSGSRLISKMATALHPSWWTCPL